MIMTVELSTDELNLILSAVGVSLNIVQDSKARDQLLALQSYLMAIRDGNQR